MTWLAVADAASCHLDMDGLEPESRPRNWRSSDLLTRGSLMFEATPEGNMSLSLADLVCADGRPFHISLDGTGTVTLRFGSHHITLEPTADWHGNALHILLVWDMSTNQAKLAQQVPGAREFTAIGLPEVPQFTFGMLQAAQDRPVTGPHLQFRALADHVMTFGSQPGIAAGTPVLTPFGYRKISTLKRGDLVLTEDGRTALPVLHSLRARLPARGAFRPVRLHAPLLELKQDIVVSASQTLVISGCEMEYTFGTETVLARAGAIGNDRKSSAPCGPVAEYLQLILPEHAALDAAGSRLDSLYIGRLRRRRTELSQTLLAQLPRADLPEHIAPLGTILQDRQSRAMSQMRAA